MSVLDELKGLEERVVARIAELESAVGELDELRAAAKRLGIDVKSPAQRAPKRRRRGRGRTTAAKSQAAKSKTARSQAAKSSQRAPKARGTQTRQKSTSRRDQVLAIVKRRPGVTVADVGRQLRVAPSSLYRVVHDLESDGQLTKSGRELRPASR